MLARRLLSNRNIFQKLKGNIRSMASHGHDDHGHHHEHMMPPFARLPPPDKNMVHLFDTMMLHVSLNLLLNFMVIKEIIISNCIYIYLFYYKYIFILLLYYS